MRTATTSTRSPPPAGCSGRSCTGGHGRTPSHGKKDPIHQTYLDGMEDQRGSLGLVLNAVVLWTPCYLDAAVDSSAPRATRSVTRKWPGSPRYLKQLNLLVGYNFTATQPAGGILRPLRDPDTAGPDDEDGAED
jgi:hypothetical protein